MKTIDKFSLNGNIKGLIFDCDGTLVDSMPLHMKAWKEAFRQFNERYDEKFLFSLKGMKEIEIIQLYNMEFQTSIEPEKILIAKHEYFLRHISEVKPIKPVVDVVKSYFGKLPLAVVSGSVKEIVHSELKVVGIYDLFNIILTADDPFKPKPNPEIFITAASKIKISPESCLVFEDGDPGLEAAVRAGMQTIDVRKYL